VFVINLTQLIKKLHNIDRNWGSNSRYAHPSFHVCWFQF